MSDFTVSVDFDASAILRGFAKLEQDAKAAGASAGKGLAEGLQGFSSKSITALQQELQRLTQRQLKVDVDSRAFTVTGERIRAVQAQLDSIQRKQVAIGVDDRSITALQSKLQALQSRQVRVDVDSSEFVDLQRQINIVERELADVERKRIRIDVDANSITAITSRLQADLDRLQQRQLRIDVDSQEFRDLGREIDRIQDELAQVERKRVTVGVDDRSITALQSKLQQLQARQVKVDVDSSEFLDLQREINRTQTEIAEIERNRVLIDVDSNSITALNVKLQGMQNELSKVAIGSQRFRELQGAIEDTQRELARAGESADQFRLLDGVIQGVAFSLSNALIDGAGRALGAVGNLIGGFARLDTEIRKAAAAGGESGGYGRLSKAIDSVGIEAAGTQQEVAQLTTELVRGGLTIDQTTQSLGAIVRGAEATGTAYATMGSVVSAALKGFGLEARDASRVVDALVTGANASAGSVEGMGNAFKYAAPVAKILGISMEDLGIAIGLMTNAGISAEEAGVTLRNGLSKLASAAPQAAGATQKLTGQAAEAAKAMKALGVNIYNADGTLKPMEQTLLKLKGAFDKLGPSSKIRLAANLFGGEDDGTKWLALLNQSEDEIKKMAAAMANTKGATDIARDAMQGFELTMAQLTGTLDSLGNNVGRIAAGALLPLVNAANAVVGAISGLPGPVKDTVIAVGLLAGAVVGATTAYVVFQRVLQANITQQAIAGTVDLARAIGATLVSGITTAASAWPAFIAQLRLASTAQFTLVGSLNATAAALKAQFIAAMTGAKAALASLVAALNSATFAQFIAGAKAAVLALAPLALAIGAITAAVVVWQQTLSESNAAQKLFGEASEKSAESNRKLEQTIGSLGQKVTQNIGIWQQLSNFLSEEMGMREAAIQMRQLQESMNAGEESARAFYVSIREGTAITAENVAKGKAYVEWLNTQAQLLAQVIAAMRAKADQAEREGKLDLANQYRDQANGLEAQARGAKNLSAAIQEKVQAQGRAAGIAATELAMTEEQVKLNEKRIDTEAKLNQLIAEAPIRNLDAQLAVGQQLLNLAQAIGQAEQSRYAVTRSALGFELQQAEKRGASEQQIGAIKARIEANDKAALQARFQALTTEQALQRTMLALTQEKARTEANLAVMQQRAELLKAQAELQKAVASGDRFAIDAAQAQVNLQQQILGIQQNKVGLLAQTQPLERAALGFQQQAATNGLRAEAAAKGYQFALDGTLKPANRLVELQGRIGTIGKASVADQQRYAALAERSGIAIGKAADGTVVLGRTQDDVNTAVEEMNRQLTGAQGGLSWINTAMTQVVTKTANSAEEAAGWRKAASDAGLAIGYAADNTWVFGRNAKEVDDTAKKIGSSMKSAGASTAATAEEARRFGQNVSTAGMYIGKAKDGSALITNTWEDFNRLADDASRKVYSVKSGYDATGKSAGQTKTATDGIRQALQSAGAPANQIAAFLGNTETKVKGAKGETDKLKGSLQDSATPAGGIATAFTKVGKNAPAAAQGARDFASFLSSAKTFAERIANLNLGRAMSTVASETNRAATAAKTFYEWLARASDLPGSRWTGGPVEAGGEYKINELGQEAFLAGGRLSLINAAPNSVWRAPSDGVVIPAGMTAQLQARAAVEASGGSAGVAELAVEVGKLRAEVGNLARRDWSVHVQHRTGPTGSQVMRTLLS